MVRILKQRFGVEIYIFKKSNYNFLEIFIHTITEPILHNTDDLIIMLHPQDHILNLRQLLLIRI